MGEYQISARLTFSNSLLKEEHLRDRRCNELCRIFSKEKKNGVIVHSELLRKYLQEEYPDLYLVSSTTKVITDFAELLDEINREEFSYVVPDFRLNWALDQLGTLSESRRIRWNSCVMNAVGLTARIEKPAMR